MIDKQAGGRQSTDHFSLRRNQSLIPDQVGTAWQVESGTIEVFGTRFEGDNPVGHRRHLFTIPAGRTLFGFHLIPKDTPSVSWRLPVKHPKYDGSLLLH